MELIHTCYRITDPERSIAFYEALGLEKRRELPIRDEAINVFMGLPGDEDRLELTFNHGVDSYELGTGYNHIALTVDDLDALTRVPAHVGLARDAVEDDGIGRGDEVAAAQRQQTGVTGAGSDEGDAGRRRRGRGGRRRRL